MTAIEAPATLRLWIPGRPPTPNARRNHWARAKDDRTWKDLAWKLGLDAVDRSGWRTPSFARVEVTFVVPTRAPRDKDNLVAAHKPVLDGLCRAGVIAGDSSRHIVISWGELSYRRGITGAEYVIEAAPGDGLWP